MDPMTGWIGFLIVTETYHRNRSKSLLDLRRNTRQKNLPRITRIFPRSLAVYAVNRTILNHR